MLEDIDLRVAAVDQVTDVAATLADSAEVLVLKAAHVGPHAQVSLGIAADELSDALLMTAAVAPRQGLMPRC